MEKLPRSSKRFLLTENGEMEASRGLEERLIHGELEGIPHPRRHAASDLGGKEDGPSPSRTRKKTISKRNLYSMLPLLAT